jgi:hypothetical protein
VDRALLQHSAPMALRITKEDGAGTIAIPLASSAEVRARDCYDAIVRGAFKTRIADAQVVTAKKVVSFPQKSGQFAEEINLVKAFGARQWQGKN